MSPVFLSCHPAAASPAVAAIEVRAAWSAAGLTLAFCLRGRLAELAVPAPLPPGPADGLWQHTCFEAFVAADETAAYREFNFSPSGRWAAYAFSDYRRRDESFRPPAEPEMAVRRCADRLELEAHLPPALLPAAACAVQEGVAGLRLGLSAVVETADGARSYWALAHPDPSRPDFHRRETFEPVKNLLRDPMPARHPVRADSAPRS